MNILIVDDDMAFVRSMQIVLKEHGHQVTCFCDPATADLYIKGDPDVDLLLLDYSMGPMNGDELLEKVGDSLPACCETIMITGHREKIHSSNVLKALGVRQVLCKPLNLDELCRVVDRYQ